MNVFGKSIVERKNRRVRGKSALTLASSMALAGLLPTSSVRAITPTWTGTTNNNWEATGTENNWGTAGIFPGNSTSGSITNTDTAYFGNTIANANVLINATVGNTLPLNIGNIGFTGQTTTATPTNYVIGTAGGNALVATSDTALNGTTTQYFISGSLRGAALASITATINAPIILAAQNSSAPAYFAFQNNSTANAADLGDKLVINGSITGGSTSAAGSYLTLTGGNTNFGNALNGGISNGGITAGLGVDKIGGGIWTIGGANTYTGFTISTGGVLNITGTNTGGGNYNVSGSTIIFNSSGTVTAGNLNITSTGGTFNVAGGTVNVTGSVTAAATSNGRSFNLYGGGILEVGTSIYSTATGDLFNINNGTIKAGNAAGLAFDATTATTNTNHTCNIQAGGVTLDTTIGNINSTALFQGFAAGPITVTGGQTFLSNIQNNGLLTVQGTSTWDMNGSGGSTTPVFNNSSVNGLAGSGSIVNSSATAGILTVSVPASTTATYSGKIAPSTTSNVSLVLSGAGTQIFSGTGHTFTGGVNVSAGTLAVSGSLTSSAITVNGGFLSGNGNGTTTGAVGAVTLGANGTLDPGIASTDGSIGTLSLTSLDGTLGAERFDLASPGASDTINVGSATFSAANTFTLVGTPIAGTYTLVNSATALAGAGPTFNFPTGTRSIFTPQYGTVNPDVLSLVVTGNAANLTWTGSASNVWDVNNSVNWNNGTGADKFFNLDSITFGNGAANESISLNTTVQPTAMTVNNDGSNTYTIAGTGSIIGVNTAVTKLGVGTLVMATNNTYGGGTNISSGIVQVGNGGTTGSLGSGTVLDNGTLVFNLSSGTTQSIAINGTGILRQSGVGTLTVTSSNNYSGSTIIDTGTVLQLGNGGTTGNLGATSDVQDNGTLVYNRSNTSTISVPITGSGSLQVLAGNLSLGANNSYLGTTTIAAGATLQIGSGGTTGSLGAGALTNNGTLAFNRSDNVIVPVLGGIGGIQQNGAGQLILNTSNSYSGLTTASNGTLIAQNPNAFGNTPSINVSSGAAILSFQSDTTTTFAQPTGGAAYNINLTSNGGTLDVNQKTTAGTAAKVFTLGNVSAAGSTSTPFSLTFTGANNTGLTLGTVSGPTASAPTITINNNNVAGTTTLANYQSNNTNGSGIETLNFNGSGTTVITGGILNGAGDMNINFNGGVSPGTGQVTIQGSSTYGGVLTGTSTQITNGIVAIGNDNAFGGTTPGNASFEILNLNAPDPAVGVIESADTNTRTIGNTVSQSSTNFTYGAVGTGNLVFTNVFNKGQFPKNLIVNCPVMTLSGGIFSTGTANGDGTFGSNGALIKSGPGTLILTADSSVSQVTNGANFQGLYLSTPVAVNAGTLVVANGLNNGSATGTNDVTVNGGILASDPTNGGSILGNVLAGTGAHTIAPGGVGAIGTLEVGGLTTSNLTTLNFDLGTGSGVVTDNDLLLLGYLSGTPVHALSVSVGSGTAITVAGATTIGNDYRLIGDFSSGATISTINLANFSVLGAPSGQSYSLSTNVDPGFIDLVVGVGAAGPSNLTWNNTGGSGDGTTWNTAQINWNNGTGAVAYSNTSNTATGDNVTFNDTNNGHYAVTISGVVNPSSVVFNNSTGNYTVTGANSSSGIAGTTSLTKLGTGSVTLSSNNSYTGGTAVNAGKLILASANAFPVNGSLNVSSGAQVTIANHSTNPTYVPQLSSLQNNGSIDVTNNAFLVHNGSVATISTEVGLGYNNGSWNGANASNGVIGSSMAAGDSTHLTAVGVATGLTSFEGSTVAVTDVLVKYTYYGDANLDGHVDGSDYSRIDSGFLSHSTGWFNGDFNYDGIVNGSDYTLIDNAFNSQGASIAAELASPTAQIAGSGASAVPEPTSLALLGIGAAGLLGRRRRGRGH